jgi:UDP-glucose 4,6-dehydratase
VKIVVTGGAGFLGSHIVDLLVDTYPGAQIVVFDKLTYAGDLRNVEDAEKKAKIDVVVGDICDQSLCRRTLSRADLLIHTAAESHVDNSFGNSLEFTTTNVLGTHVLLEACRFENVPRILHVSTDEVYGEIPSGSAHEGSPIMPTNPYSASKAAAEMIVMGYWKSYKAPITMVRGNNIFGIRQYPEKIIPIFIMKLLSGQKLPLHGNGKNQRHYVSAPDAAKAVLTVVEKGELMQIYNIGSKEEYSNLEIAGMICEQFGYDPKDWIDFVPDRPYNDIRYGVTADRISALGWDPKRSVKDDLPAIVEWYKKNGYRYSGFG